MIAHLHLYIMCVGLRISVCTICASVHICIDVCIHVHKCAWVSVCMCMCAYNIMCMHDTIALAIDHNATTPGRGIHPHVAAYSINRERRI